MTQPIDTDVLVVGLTESGVIGVPADVDQTYSDAFTMGVAEMGRTLGAKSAACNACMNSCGSTAR